MKPKCNKCQNSGIIELYYKLSNHQLKHHSDVFCDCDEGRLKELADLINKNSNITVQEAINILGK